MATMRVNHRRSRPLRRGSTSTLPSPAARFLVLSTFFLLFAASYATTAVPSFQHPDVCPRALGPEYSLSEPPYHCSASDTTPSTPKANSNAHSDQDDKETTKKPTENDDKEDTSPQYAPTTRPVAATTPTTEKAPRAEANLKSKQTQTQTQTTTSAPFPASMYDTPGHAIASGLFIGTAGTVLCWVIGFILKVYATWIWRAVVGVARGLEPVPLDRMLMQD